MNAILMILIILGVCIGSQLLGRSVAFNQPSVRQFVTSSNGRILVYAGVGVGLALIFMGSGLMLLGGAALMNFCLGLTLVR